MFVAEDWADMAAARVEREAKETFHTMKIDPDLEAFFVAIALEHGTHPYPRFGIERN